MNKRKIFTLGETILDIIFKNNMVKEAKPGGSMLNTSVSIGRLGIPIYFISELADDSAGKLILNFLKSNNISNEYINIYKTNAQTGISLAFLNKKMEATYNFYKKIPQNRTIIKKKLNIKPDDIIAISSFFAIDDNIHQQVEEILNIGKKNNCIIYYDINFRKSHINQLNILRKNINNNISKTTILRGSIDDFYLVYNEKKPENIYKLLFEKNDIKVLIITNGNKNVHLFTKKTHQIYTVPKIPIISSIGAGDNFNAGILYGLYNYDITTDLLDSLSNTTWGTIINVAIKFAQNVCSTYNNYISYEIAKHFRIKQ